MKSKVKNKSMSLKSLLAAGLLVASLSSIGQGKSAVIADAKLAQMEITDFSGNTVDANNLQTDQLVKLKLPVAFVNHGMELPAGSCKIKVGLGSKFMVDPGFDVLNSGLGNYFRWTSVESNGQVELTGELVNNLPANIQAADLSFRIKVKEEGKAVVTANFLITNHATTTVLSDENGANNVSALSYQVGKRVPVDPSVTNGNLKLAVYPNPARNVKAVNISVLQGKLLGKYKISLFDLAGKLLQTKELQLDFASNFTYDFGNIAAGKYLIIVLNTNGTESSVLKFEKF